MVFEIVKKRANNTQLEENEISITNASIRFSSSFNRLISKNRKVQVYFDRPNKKIGFKFTKNSVLGYNSQWLNRGRTYFLNVQRIVSLCPKGRYLLKKEQGLWTTSIPKL